MKSNKSTRNTARMVGALFLIAMVSSLTGAFLIEAVIAAPDYLSEISGKSSQLYAGVYLEIINGLSVVGIAALMYRIIRQYRESFAAAYLGIRILESMVCIAAGICPLLLLTLGQEYAGAGGSETAGFQLTGTLIYAARGYLASLLVPVTFGISALLFYLFLYRTILLPRFISVWGLIAVGLMLTFNLLRLDQSIGLIFIAPIILNEVFMGIWLIVKGFNSSEN